MPSKISAVRLSWEVPYPAHNVKNLFLQLSVSGSGVFQEQFNSISRSRQLCLQYIPVAYPSLLAFEMASINKCLKWVFIFFNAFFALTGAVFVAIAEAAAVRAETGHFWPLIFGGLVAGISTLGVYGAYKEKKWALILFSVLVCIGMVLCLVGAVNMVNVRAMLTTKVEDVFKGDEMNQYFQVLQEEYKLECCGTVNGYKDWNSEIPASCICPESHQGTPTCKKVAGSPRTYEYWQRKETSTEVYKEPCLPMLMRYFDMALDATVGTLFGLAIVALIGTIMAILMICQLRKQMAEMPMYEYSKPPAYNGLVDMYA